MKIAITLPSTSSINTNSDGQNVQGDEMIARSWKKYLERNNGFKVDLLNGYSGEKSGYDHVIHFSIFYDVWKGTHNILYFQNVFPPESWEGGTLGQFNNVKHKYDDFIFTSSQLMENCDSEGCVIPFAVDEEIYKPTRIELYDDNIISFVGNSIRGDVVNSRYIKPALSEGLKIYGNQAGWGGEYNNNLMGKIEQIPNEPALYTESKILLNCHINEHILHNTLNYRVYCILACGGIIISDRIKAIDDHFSEYIVTTDGNGDLKDKISEVLGNYDHYKNAAAKGMEYVLACHTFTNRMDNLSEYLKGI